MNGWVQTMDAVQPLHLKCKDFLKNYFRNYSSNQNSSFHFLFLMQNQRVRTLSMINPPAMTATGIIIEKMSGSTDSAPVVPNG